MDPNDKWLNSQRYQWWGAPQRSADKNDDANSTKKDNNRTKEDERKADAKGGEKRGEGLGGVDEQQEEREKVDRDARKKASRKVEGERLARMFEDELGLRKRR